METLDAGEIYIGNQRIDQLPPYERPVNTVFQSYALFPHMSVADNVAFGLEMEKKPTSEIRATVADMLDFVYLSDMGSCRPSQATLRRCAKSRSATALCSSSMRSTPT